MRKYDLFMVKVIVDGVETVVKTSRDVTSYSEMKELYSKTVSRVEYGDVMLVGVNSLGYTTIYSKNIEKEEEEMDVIVSNLIENINSIVKYAENAHILEGSMNMSKDMYLKNIELFNDFELDDEEENRRKKEEIFDELRDLLKLRRKVKYNTLLAKKIVSKTGLSKLVNKIELSKKSLKYNSCLNVSKKDIVKQEEYDVKEFFDLETINKISQMREENDKILIMQDKIVGYNKSSNLRDDKLPSQINEGIANSTKSNVKDFIVGDIVYKCPEHDFENKNSTCVKQKAYINVADIHLENFIKNKSKKYNLITFSKSKAYCYRFENKNELKFFDKKKFNKLNIRNIEDVFGDIAFKNQEVDFNSGDFICTEKEMYDNIQTEHFENFIKNKSKKFNLITKKKRYIYCYKFEKINKIESQELVS